MRLSTVPGIFYSLGWTPPLTCWRAYVTSYSGIIFLAPFSIYLVFLPYFFPPRICTLFGFLGDMRCIRFQLRFVVGIKELCLPLDGLGDSLGSVVEIVFQMRLSTVPGIFYSLGWAPPPTCWRACVFTYQLYYVVAHFICVQRLRIGAGIRRHPCSG